jgi:hypothetical protein
LSETVKMTKYTKIEQMAQRSALKTTKLFLGPLRQASGQKKYRELTLLQLTYYPQPYFLLQHLGIPSGQMSKAPRSYHY